MAIDSDIDALYQLPLDQFTPARNALAKRLTGQDRTAVSKLTKPTVVPWAVNQLYWHARALFDRLRKSGERLRAAQIAALKGRSADVRSAADAHRQALASAVQEALGLAEKAGSRPDPDELTRTLESLSLAQEDVETPGRLTRPLRPAGFEALAGVTPAAIPPAKPSVDRDAGSHGRTSHEHARRGASAAHEPEVETARARRERERRERLEQEEREARAQLDRAEAVLDRARAAETEARAAWNRAKNQVDAAERTVAEARRRLKP